MLALKRGFQVKAKVKLWIYLDILSLEDAKVTPRDPVTHTWSLEWLHMAKAGFKMHHSTHIGVTCATARLDVLPFYKKLMAVWCIRLLKDGAFFASCRFGMALLHHMKYWQSGPFGVEGTITPWRKTSAECYDRIERIERKCPPWHRKSVFASTQITNSSSGSLDFFCVQVRRKSPMVAYAVPNFTINEKGYSIA